MRFSFVVEGEGEGVVGDGVGAVEGLLIGDANGDDVWIIDAGDGVNDDDRGMGDVVAKWGNGDGWV